MSNEMSSSPGSRNEYVPSGQHSGASIRPSVPFRLELTGDFLLLLTLTWFFCGGESLGALTLAAAVHELGHAAAMLLQGQLPRALRLDGTGLCLRCPPPGTEGRELLRTVAGPAAGLLLTLALMGSGAPFLRLCARASLALSVLNLLPASCLDGGRLLRSLGCLLLGPLWAERIAAALDWACAAAFALLGVQGRWDWLLWSAWLLAQRLRRG